MNRTFEDAFEILCGPKIAFGSSREVFQCRIRSDLVVKVEIERPWRTYENFRENLFWDEAHEKTRKWLAPVEYTSPDTRILLQRRVDPLPSDYALPYELPEFLTDLKKENFGLLNGNLVCVDYALFNSKISLRMKPAKWWIPK